MTKQFTPFCTGHLKKADFTELVNKIDFLERIIDGDME